MRTSQHQRASIVTFTGTEFFPLAPRSEDIWLVDLAHALSMTCRYNGHTIQFYSVAQHCCVVAEWLDKNYLGWAEAQPDDQTEKGDVVRWGLLHDAAEAYLPDVCSPIKRYFDPVLAEAERHLELAVAERFGLPHEMDDRVKYADRAVFRSEVESGIVRKPDWWKFDAEHPDAGMNIFPWPQQVAKTEFIRMFRKLFGDATYDETSSPQAP